MSKNTKRPDDARPFTWAGRGRTGAALLYPSGKVVVTAVDGHPLNTGCKSFDSFVHTFKVIPRSVEFTDTDPRRRITVELTFASSAAGADVARQLRQLAEQVMGHRVESADWREFRTGESEDP